MPAGIRVNKTNCLEIEAKHNLELAHLFQDIRKLELQVSLLTQENKKLRKEQYKLEDTIEARNEHDRQINVKSLQGDKSVREDALDDMKVLQAEVHLHYFEVFERIYNQTIERKQDPRKLLESQCAQINQYIPLIKQQHASVQFLKDQLVEARRRAMQADHKAEAMKKRVVELLRIKHYHEKLVEYLRDGGDFDDFRADEVLEGEAEFRLDSPIVYKESETPINKPLKKVKKQEQDQPTEEAKPNWVSTEQLKVYQQQADKIDRLHLETIELRLVIQEYQTRIALLNEEMSQMRFEKKAEAVASLEQRLEEITLENEDLRRKQFQMGIDLDETFGKAARQEKVSENAMEQMKQLDKMLSQNRETCEALRSQLEQERQYLQNLRHRLSAFIQFIGMERTVLAIDQGNWVISKYN